MADIRNIGGRPLVPQARPAPARTEAVRAAQRAFFQAALAAEPPPAAPRTAAPVVQPVASASGRPLRPGSLVDIKV
jgi:predicted component of type VI protein secretion system